MLRKGDREKVKIAQRLRGEMDSAN